MRDKSLLKLGGVCCVFVGIGYALIGILYLIDPVQRAQDEMEYFALIAQNPISHIALHVTTVLMTAFALGAIPAISQLVRSENEGWVHWTTNLVYLGSAILAMENSRALDIQPALGQAFATGDPMTLAALEVVEPLQSLAQKWFLFGIQALWLSTINLIALRKGLWPRSLACLGVVLAIACWLVPVGELLNIALLYNIAAALGGAILSPIWFIWMGLTLRRRICLARM